jgi:hypothetical protein
MGVKKSTKLKKLGILIILILNHHKKDTEKITKNKHKKFIKIEFLK